jgi:hypothetical protein
MSMDPGLGGYDPTMARDVGHPNPLFRYQKAFAPRKLKDLLKWAEYLAHDSAHIYAVVRKFGEYPITKFVYHEGGPKEKERHQDLFDNQLKLKGFLTKVSFDKWVYGNSFISLYEPFRRSLVCQGCGGETNIKVCKDYTFSLDTLAFKFSCPSCKSRQVGKIHDAPIADRTRLALIRWDPKLIDIDPNPYTGEHVYYYTIPRDIVERVRGGNRHLINTTPYEILVAMQRKKTFRFAPGQLFHLKMPGPAGVESQWGLPPLTAAIDLFLFAATLRKANEAIAMEHITPLRVMFPQGASGNGDPVTTISLDEWRRQMEKNLRMFKTDPLRVMFSPTALGLQNIGGDGRAMLTIAELKEAEQAIVLSLGVPMEFITGGLGQTRGEITLRMIENQLQTHIEDLNDVVRWVEKKIARVLSWESIEVKLADFKMIDDTDRKNFFLQLFAQGKISQTRIFEMFEIDGEKERKQIREDAINDAKAQTETQRELGKLQNSLSAQATSQAAMQQGRQSYDQQAMIAQADQVVQDLMQYDPGTRRSRMDGLQAEDIVMYALVKERMEQQNQDATQAAKSQASG